jgi:hypothetical protein
LTINFPPNTITQILEGLDQPTDPIETRHKAWVEFCVELDDDVNIYTTPLQPSSPFTSFSDTDGNYENYPIDSYIDESICLVNDVLDRLSLPKIGEACTYVRANTTQCGGCDCCTGWWCWLTRIFTSYH